MSATVTAADVASRLDIECAACQVTLDYFEVPDGTPFLRHSRNDCKFGGFVYTLPTA